MKQYNIYAGLTGSFGGDRYQFTTLCDDIYEAEDIAYQTACDIYEQYEGLYGLYNWNNAIIDYCNENDIDRNDITEEDDLEIQQYYDEGRETYLAYHAVLTKKDNIDSKDLILDYIIDDNSSQADSE